MDINTIIYLENKIDQNPGGGSIIIINDTYSLFEDETVTVSVGTYSKTAVIEDGTAIIKGFIEVGNITISVDNYTKTIYIQDYSKYEVPIGAIGGFRYQDWLESIDKSSEDYYSLDDVLADEKMVRELFTKHASVDYLISVSGSSDIETIINNDYCAKWINLRDYALDTLYADSNISVLMDDAEKYFYGEWTLLPQIPTLTSNTAPYGEAKASAVYGEYQPWRAFRSIVDSSYGWVCALSSNQWISYSFPKAVNIRKLHLSNCANSSYLNQGVKNFKLQYSDDEVIWNDVYLGVARKATFGGENTNEFFDIPDGGSHIYWRLYCIDNYGSNCGIGIANLQLYAWGAKGIVPVMTGNTIPFGTASASSAASDSSGGKTRQAWGAFNQDPYTTDINSISTVDANQWRPANNSLASSTYIQYSHTGPISIKKISINYTALGLNVTAKLQGSNDGTTWDDLTDTIEFDHTKGADTGVFYKNIEINAVNNTSNYYMYIRLQFLTTNNNNKMNDGSYTFIAIGRLQLYGRGALNDPLIPLMTSNTTPYGEAFSNHSSNQTYGSAYYHSFDRSTSTQVEPVSQSAPWSVGYAFVNPVKVDILRVLTRTSYNSSNQNIFQASDDRSNWITLHNRLPLTQARTTYTIPINSDRAYKYYRIYLPGGSYDGFPIIQMYGNNLNYSEYDWDADNPRHYIYDHGVELEEIDYSRMGKEASYISFNHTDSSLYTDEVNSHSKIDLMDYSKIRITISGSVPWSSSGDTYGAIAASKTKNTSYGNWTSFISVKTTSDMHSLYLDTSSINTSEYVIVGSTDTAGRKWDISEIWLE